jgi:ABC-type spermidine/putrescine transport system permease subunit II
MNRQAERAAGLPLAIPAMTTTTALILALLLLPILILLWATESRQQRARRWRRDGWTQQRIADRLGCSRTTVRRLLAG